MTPLFAEVNRWSGQRFQWGISDCVMLVADWVLRVTGHDPAADLRFCYASAAECQRVTGFFTDPLAVIGPRMQRIGLAQTSAPVRGDVGLLMQAENGLRQRIHAGLCLGAHWAVQGEATGVQCGIPQKIIAAWSVGYHDH